MSGQYRGDKRRPGMGLRGRGPDKPTGWVGIFYYRTGPGNWRLVPGPGVGLRGEEKIWRSEGALLADLPGMSEWYGWVREPQTPKGE